MPPVDLDFAEMRERGGVIDLADHHARAADLFPEVARWLSSQRTVALAGLSRIVGMECPGLYSVFSGFAVDLVEPVDPVQLGYTVVAMNAEMRVVRVAVTGSGISGMVEAFLRRAPQEQLSYAEASARVVPGEFAGQRALIVGGSRGLGEAAAKILAAGGASVVITYAKGRNDADRVAGEIVAGGGTCSIRSYDATEPAAPQLADLDVGLLDSMYYFATGPIFDRRLRAYEPARFERFCAYYVHGFADLCHEIAGRKSNRLAILYPSSIAIETRPRELIEYAMAKAAGEVLCAGLGRPPLRLDIHVHRFPRLRTDQTASIQAVAEGEPPDILLPVVRTVQAGSASARR